IWQDLSLVIVQQPASRTKMEIEVAHGNLISRGNLGQYRLFRPFAARPKSAKNHVRNCASGAATHHR
ncbi:MAG TPA: hypothetical protein VE267_18775, partial [Bradyrhizobium sp.]|nr:hypothetical protein [Bradyrhizobium sp.]